MMTTLISQCACTPKALGNLSPGLEGSDDLGQDQFIRRSTLKGLRNCRICQRLQR